MIFLAVFLVSFSTLAIEILMTRFFSIAQWNHLSFMVISFALFGFALSGTVLSILFIRRQNKQTSLCSKTAICLIVTFFSAATLFAFIALNRIPLDYFRLTLEPIQLVYLLSACLLLALPFFFSGMVIALAYSNYPAKTGWVYFVSMAGSAGGALAPAILLPIGGEENLIILTALVPLIFVPAAGALALVKKTINQLYRRPTVWAGASLWALTVVFSLLLFTSQGGSLINIRPSAYKALSQIRQFPNTRIIDTRHDIRAKTDSVATPYIRFAPGLSLKYSDPLPSQRPIFEDADNQFVLYDVASPPKIQFAQHTLAYAGYQIQSNPGRILLILSNGGLSIACALSSGSDDVSVLHQNPYIVAKIRDHYNLDAINQDPRRFLARSDHKFDVIQIENWGPSIPGASALNQEHVFTVEAFESYLHHLSPTGIMVISRKLLLPPSDSLRLWATAYEALSRFDIADPAAHIAVLRNWDTFTLLVTARPINIEGGLMEFALRHNFDLVFLPGIREEHVNRFNRFKQPFYYTEIRKLAKAYVSDTEAEFFRQYLLDVAPQSDSRPFPGRFLKWQRLMRLYESMGSRANTLIMSGEIVVVLVFIEALLVSIVLLLLPLKLISRHGKRPGASKIVFFLAVGAGFMFLELYFIKRYTLFFGDPIIAFTVVVSGILIFSGFGGLWAQTRSACTIRPGIWVLIGVVVFTFFSLEFYGDNLMTLANFWKYAVAILLLMPAGFLMGLPFPLGMQHSLNGSVQRAYAWSVNGCASILATIASAQIALGSGIPVIMGCAVGAYLVALVAQGQQTQGNA